MAPLSSRLRDAARKLFWCVGALVMAMAVSDLFAQISLANDMALPVVFTNTLEIRQMIEHGVATNCSVRLEGVITWIDPEINRLVLQDESGGMAVKMDLRGEPLCQPGDRIIIEADCELNPAGMISMPLIDNDGLHGSQERSATLSLSAGPHPIYLEWFNGPAQFELVVDCAKPGMTRRRISELFHLKDDSRGAIGKLEPGVNYREYEGEWKRLPNFAGLPILKTGVTSNIDLDVRSRDTNVGIVFSGYYVAPVNGLYTFWLRSDDGSKLYFGNPLRITRLRSGELPPIRKIVSGQFTDPDLEWRWSEIEGVVTRVKEIRGGTAVEAAVGAERVNLRIIHGDYGSLKALVHHRINANGIYENAYDTDGQTVPSLIVPDPKNLIVLGEDRPTIEAGDTHGLPLLTEVIKVKSLSRAEAQRGYPVKIAGVITARSGTDFVIQDSTWSIFCFWSGSGNEPLPEIGEFWEIEGNSDVHFAPDIVVHRAAYVRPGILPEPIHPTQDAMINGSLDTQYIEMQGIATAVSTNTLRLLTRDNKLEFYGLDLTNASFLEGALVRIRGVYIPERETNQMIRVRLSPLKFFNALVSIDEPAPAHPFEIPLKHVADLHFFDAQADVLRRIKVAGQVQARRKGEYFLTDGINGLRFEPSEQITLEIGDLVEVVGFPDVSGPSPVLREALARVTGHAPLPDPLQLSETFTPAIKFDDRRVTLQSRLVSTSLDQFEQVFEAQVGPRTFRARLANGGGLLPDILPGSLLQLTGVYVAADRSRVASPSAESFDLLLNSAAEVRVLERPSWWTARHTLTVIGSMIVVIVVALIWITQLRRQVEERSRQLASEIAAREQAEYQHALEAERARIAQDLHDDLGATLTEIRFLSAVKSRDLLVPSVTRTQLMEVSEKSRQMVSSLDEIVWAVNPSNDSLPSLAAYLRHVAEEFFRSTEVRCRLDVDHNLPSVALTSEIRHNLFLVVREALNNIAKHSQATEAWLRIHWQDRTLRIVVEDNGRGFDADVVTAENDGLSNMRDRLEKIGGRFECSTSVGAGTICRIYLSITE